MINFMYFPHKLVEDKPVTWDSCLLFPHLVACRVHDILTQNYTSSGQDSPKKFIFFQLDFYTKIEKKDKRKNVQLK